MILSAAPVPVLAVLAIAAYLAAAWRAPDQRRWPLLAMCVAWLLQVWLLLEGAWTVPGLGVRIGFGPVLSVTVALVVLVHAIESRLLPVAGVRRVLALVGAAAVLVDAVFPGEMRAIAHSSLAPLHWILGLTSYGLFGAAVLHALMLDAAEQRLRLKSAPSATAFGMPLLKLEKLTFRFVEAGFAVLTLALVLGLAEPRWRWDHKTVLSLLGWLIFAALIVGRIWRGWRGRQATRWLYAGTLMLLLAYVGSRFVLEVLLQRHAAG
jgi:ABC-type uncharacterized transport system permease subunit